VRTAWFWWRATRLRTWRSTVVVILLTGVLGAVSMAALAGARRTESAYGRYLQSVNASDVMVNIPTPDTSLIQKVASVPGVTSSAAWVGIAANPVVHGRVDPAFQTNDLSGSVNGAFFRQDDMTIIAGRLPPLNSTDQVILTPGIARLFGVGVGDRVTYRLYNPLITDSEVMVGSATFEVAAIGIFPPALVDQFDETSGAALPPGATARLNKEVSYSWVDLRLDRGRAGVPALQSSLARLADKVGEGISFNDRQMDRVHQQVQDAIRPQAVALAIFGLLAFLALLVLVGQSLAQLLDRSAPQLRTLQALGLHRRGTALAGGFGAAVAVVGGMVLAVAGAVALSPLAPLEPVRQFDPARGVQFDPTVLVGVGLVATVLLLAVLGWLAWRVARPDPGIALARPSVVAQAADSAGLPKVVALGTRFALEVPAGQRRTSVRASLLGSVAAVVAVVTAVVFGASLNGLVTHADRYGWNWDALMQDQGGYGTFLPPTVTSATFGDGDGSVDRLMATQPGVAGWSTFGFTQLLIDGQSVPVLGLDTHLGTVEPPTVSGTAIDASGMVHLGLGPRAGPSQIELGAATLRQLDKRVGDTVEVGRGRTARRMTIVGVVTLPSIGVGLSDHVSLGSGAMLPEVSLLAIEGLTSINASPYQALGALPSTLAIDMKPGTSARAVEARIVRAEPGGTPGGVYVQPRVLGAPIVNAGQMSGQTLALALALGVAVLISLSVSVAASARRRRRELAILRALGFTRRQLRSIVAWQTVTLLLVAVVFGLPLGIVAGRAAWAAFASLLGVVPVTVIPLAELVVGLVVLAVAGAALTALPRLHAARASTASSLRPE
jgi:ABC-type lipoprotein release transport system permease subunit